MEIRNIQIVILFESSSNNEVIIQKLFTKKLQSYILSNQIINVCTNFCIQHIFKFNNSMVGLCECFVAYLIQLLSNHHPFIN